MTCISAESFWKYSWYMDQLSEYMCAPGGASDGPAAPSEAPAVEESATEDEAVTSAVGGTSVGT